MIRILFRSVAILTFSVLVAAVFLIAAIAVIMNGCYLALFPPQSSVPNRLIAGLLRRGRA